MFTGLIQEIGKIEQASPNREGKLLSIRPTPAFLAKIKIDDSVAINGVCQTVVAVKGPCFVVQAVGTTLSKTTLGQEGSGDEVNLELALCVGDRLGGHFVQGHVNGTGPIVNEQKIGDNRLITVRVPSELGHYVVKEGSVALDGVSLTVAEKNGLDVTVSIIPHTLHSTIFKNRKRGDLLNIEVDVLAKYVEGILLHRQNGSEQGNRSGTPGWADLL